MDPLFNKNKCYECKKRFVGCHSTCEDYKKFKENLEKANKKRRSMNIYSRK